MTCTIGVHVKQSVSVIVRGKLRKGNPRSEDVIIMYDTLHLRIKRVAKVTGSLVYL